MHSASISPFNIVGQMQMSTQRKSRVHKKVSGNGLLVSKELETATWKREHGVKRYNTSVHIVSKKYKGAHGLVV